ncbi:MAG: response regulator transcription factor [Deltaproteobacteria bacterium]|nr:response regulator transcription factor [Deltaproteobacteria bacterium]
MINLLIADDHPIVRQGLKQILSNSGDIKVVAEAETCQETLNKVNNNKYDVILLDLSMPGRGGLEIIQDIKNSKHQPPILILTAYAEEQYALRALKSGASGYLVKKSAPHELVTAIKRVSSGGKYISLALAEKLAFSLASDVKLPHESLSNREYQVMSMIASGKMVNEIAGELSLSVKTISTHRARILNKMGMKSNAEITYYAIKQGLVD